MKKSDQDKKIASLEKQVRVLKKRIEQLEAKTVLIVSPSPPFVPQPQQPPIITNPPEPYYPDGAPIITCEGESNGS